MTNNTIIIKKHFKHSSPTTNTEMLPPTKGYKQKSQHAYGTI